MRAIPLLALGLLLSSLVAGCVGNSTPAATADPSSVSPFPAANTGPDGEFVPHVVVGVLDTGAIPYHEQFRQTSQPELAFEHPSSYLSGYPADTPALPLTLELRDNEGRLNTTSADYLKADEKLWESAKDRTLHWLPGTRFVGSIGFTTPLPGGGHGSMTAGRTGALNVSINDGRVLMVAVTAPLALNLAVGEDEQAEATRWMADQPFIDIQSHSWGMPFTCAGIATTQIYGWAEAFKYAREKQLVFVAAGNGAGNTGITPGYPSQCQDNSGIAGVVTVGANDNDGTTTWGNFFPAVSGDGCGNPSVNEATTNELDNSGGGTSSATPFTAGGAASLLLEARRIFRDPNVGVRDGVMARAQPGAILPEQGPLADGIFTMDELKSVLFHTALSPPTLDESDGEQCMVGTRVPTDPESPLAPGLFPFIGYGEVNRISIALGIEVLQGVKAEPERAREDQLYQQDQDARRAFWG
ncbi:MAG: S8/S53 family peptidase [Candidatus Thermoplasmatota archaeon]